MQPFDRLGDRDRGALASQLRAGWTASCSIGCGPNSAALQPVVWTTDLTVKSSAEVPAESYEEDTILGDFLRAVRQHRQDERMPLDLATYLPQRGKNRALAAVFEAGEDVSRQSLLEEAAALGADLLRGEDVL
jgi:hypothetical protein